MASAELHRVAAAPICNCASTAPVAAGSTTAVPIRRQVATTTDGGGASSAPSSTFDDVCHCGPDMGGAPMAALGRVQHRLDSLPDSDKDAFDGPLFMNRNADAFAAVPAPCYRPGVDAAEVTDRAAALLSP